MSKHIKQLSDISNQSSVFIKRWMDNSIYKYRFIKIMRVMVERVMKDAASMKKEKKRAKEIKKIMTKIHNI